VSLPRVADRSTPDESKSILDGCHKYDKLMRYARFQLKAVRKVRMRVLVATDAWHPQINGVVRTLLSTAKCMSDLGHEVVFLTPEGFRSVPLPSYPNLRVALPGRRAIARRIEAVDPDTIHVATEGPIGLAVRAYCVRDGLSFTSTYATQFPEYIASRWPVPDAWSYTALRQFHAAAAVTMVSTRSLMERLEKWNFRNLALCTRAVDTDLFTPGRPADLGLARPIFMSAGRIAVEKNLEAFLSLDLPGSKVVIGDGPQEDELRRRFPAVHFLGLKEVPELGSHLAAADVFVFPSRTDTFGLVQLEAPACGVPVAAYPVIGPKDVIGDHPVGVLDEDLRVACLRALSLPRDACRAYACRFSWEKSARQFTAHLRPIGRRLWATASAYRVDTGRGFLAATAQRRERHGCDSRKLAQ
jgi:glycosyltransferase involved in cell wall biosynthesis